MLPGLLFTPILVSAVALADESADTLDSEALALANEGEFAQAHERLRRSIFLRRAEGDAAAIASTLSLTVRVLWQTGDETEIKATLEEVLDLQHALPGDHELDIAFTLHDLGYVNRILGSFRQSRAQLEESLEIRRRRLGDRHPHVAETLHQLGRWYERRRQPTEALSHLEEALSIRREVLGPRHAKVALTLHSIGFNRAAQRDYDGSLEAYRECLDINTEAYGPVSEPVAGTLSNMSMTFHELGRLREAFDHQKRSHDIRTEILGPKHVNIALGLNNLAYLLDEMGDTDIALEMYEQSIAIRREVQGADHPDLAQSLNNLAMLFDRVGQLDAARGLAEESLAIRRRALDPDDPRIATAMANLAGVMKSQGDFVAAHRLFDEALAMRREVLGPAHPDVAYSLFSLANLLRSHGDYDGALELTEAAHAMVVDTLGRRHLQNTGLLNALGLLRHRRGDFAAAQAHFEEALDIETEVFGPRHRDIGSLLNNLARTLREQGDIEGARALFERSLAHTEQALGPDHPTLGATLHNLAILSGLLGDEEAALSLFLRSVSVVENSHGPHHRKLINPLTHLSLAHLARGDVEAARQLQDRAIEIAERELSRVDSLSEREALLFLVSVRSTLDRWLEIYDGSEDDEVAWAHVRRFKGVVAARAGAARRQARVEPELAGIAEQLADVRRELAQLAFSDRTSTDAMALLSAQQEDLERQLLSESAVFREQSAASDAGASELCEALPEGSVLVDMLRYERETVAHYVAFTLRQHDCVVTRIPLGEAEGMDAAVSGWIDVIRDPESTPARIESRGRGVSERIWEPLTEAAGDARHWLIVPDGSLAGAPLSALPTGDGFVIESHLVTYLDRAADVLPHDNPRRGTGALVAGGIDYDAERASGGESRSFLAPCAGGGFAALPATAAEADAVARRWKRRHGLRDLTQLSGAEATETAMSGAMENKALVHIASHGFFAEGACKSAIDDGVGYDPMLLSGLALASANQPPAPGSAEDGILTAAEVLSLDLSETQLVVLSACETGLGEFHSGQGVLGLRRGFSVAGVGALVMSLWSVPDEETTLLMADFYRRWLRGRGMSAAEALREAQLARLAEQGEDVRPFAWAAFISSGDWR